MENIKIPPIDEFLELITAGGGKILACKLAMDMLELTKDDLNLEVKDVITIGNLYEICLKRNS
jgi:peroxiredoxin family protein